MFIFYFNLKPSVPSSSPPPVEPELEKEAPPTPQAQPSCAPAQEEPVARGTRAYISPLAARMAKEMGIDVSTLKVGGGSGLNGTYVAADITAMSGSSSSCSSTASGTAAKPKKKAARPPPPGSSGDHSPYSDVPVPFMREVSSLI